MKRVKEVIDVNAETEIIDVLFLTSENELENAIFYKVNEKWILEYIGGAENLPRSYTVRKQEARELLLSLNKQESKEEILKKYILLKEETEKRREEEKKVAKELLKHDKVRLYTKTNS